MTRGKTRFGTRKSPVKHTRHGHIRKGKFVNTHSVGSDANAKAWIKEADYYAKKRGGYAYQKGK